MDCLTKLGRFARGGLAPGLCVALFLLARPADARADRLVWLAPARAPVGPVHIGLTRVDDSGAARLPRDARVSASPVELVEAEPSGPVRVFTATARAGTLALSAELPGNPPSTARVEVGAPAAQVAIRASPPAPVKGRDESVQLEITVLRGDGTPDPDAPVPVLRANVGEVATPKPGGGGRFTALYTLPRARFPEVAIVVAFVPWPHAASTDGALGALMLPLASAVSLPGSTEPGAAVEVEIAGARFGPVRADDAGKFLLPVIVPPGHRTATSVATDRAGNQRRRTIDLRLPPTDRIACVANPSTLPAEGTSRARLLCGVTDAFGAPANGARVIATADAGTLSSARAQANGTFEWDFVAPSVLPASGKAVLSFEYPGGGPESRDQLGIAIEPLAVASASVAVEPQPVFVGGKGTVVVEARDARGRPVVARPRLSAVSGRIGPFALAGAGRQVASYLPPPDPGDWTDVISGAVLAVPGSDVARLRAALTGTALQVQATTSGGSPVAGVALSLGGAIATTGDHGIAQFAPPAPQSPVHAFSVRVVGRPSMSLDLWALRTADAAFWFPADAKLPMGGVVPPVSVEALVALGPATPVLVEVAVVPAAAGGEPTLRYRVTDVDGAPVTGREVRWSVFDADQNPLPTGPLVALPDGWTSVSLRGVRGPVSAVVSDVATGVTATAAEVLP